MPDFCSNLVYAWESPYWRPFYERLARSFRLIIFDKRGTGLSDRGGAFPTLETRMEDLRAVMDAVGSARAVVFGSHEGCLMATLFAATYPEQTSALALFHPSLVEYLDPTYAESHLPQIREGWGTQELSDRMLDEICPTLAASAEGRAWFANWLRVGASPAMGYELNRAFMETDMAEVYAALRVPTLVLYRDMPLSSAESIAVAGRIRGARRDLRVGHRLLGGLPFAGGRRGDRAPCRRVVDSARSRDDPLDPALHRHRRVERARREPGGSGLARPARTPPCRGAARARTLPGT